MARYFCRKIKYSNYNYGTFRIQIRIFLSQHQQYQNCDTFFSFLLFLNFMFIVYINNIILFLNPILRSTSTKRFFNLVPYTMMGKLKNVIFSLSLETLLLVVKKHCGAHKNDDKDSPAEPQTAS